MAGVKGKSGRRKGFSKAVHEYLDQNRANIPQYLAEMNAQAATKQRILVTCPQCKHKHEVGAPGGGNFLALQWFLDHYYGKAPQSIDVKSKSLVLTGEHLLALLPLLAEQDRQLLLGSGQGDGELDVPVQE